MLNKAGRPKIKKTKKYRQKELFDQKLSEHYTSEDCFFVLCDESR